MPSKKYTKKFKGWNNNSSYDGVIPARYLHSGVLQQHSSSSSSSSLLWVFGGETADFLYKNDLYSIDTESGYGRKISSSSQEIPEPRDNHSAVIVNDKEMLIFSGNNDNDNDNDLFQFNFETMEWNKVEQKGSVPPPREGHSAVVHGSNMIVFGGVSLKGKTKTFLNDTFSFSLDSKEWKKLSTKGSQPEPRSGHSAVVSESNGTMIIFGGLTYATEYLNNVVFLDLYTNDWETPDMKGSIPSGREHHSAVINSSGDKMYVFGGWSQGYASNDLFEFEIEKKIWNKIKIQSTRTIAPRYGHAAVLQGTKMYIIGGRDRRMMLLGDLLECSLEELSDDEESDSEEEEETTISSRKSSSYEPLSMSSSSASPSSPYLSPSYNRYSTSSASYFDSPRTPTTYTSNNYNNNNTFDSQNEPSPRSPIPSFSSSPRIKPSYASRTLSSTSFSSFTSNQSDDTKDNNNNISSSKTKEAIEPIKTEDMGKSSYGKELSPLEKESFDRFDDFDDSKFDEKLNDNDIHEEDQKQNDREIVTESPRSDTKEETQQPKYDEFITNEKEENEFMYESDETKEKDIRADQEDNEKQEFHEPSPKDTGHVETVPRFNEKQNQEQKEEQNKQDDQELLTFKDEKEKEANQVREEPETLYTPEEKETSERLNKEEQQEEITSKEQNQEQQDQETESESTSESNKSSLLNIPDELEIEDTEEVADKLTNINQSHGAHEFIIFSFSTLKKHKNRNYLTLIGTGNNGFNDIKPAVSSKSYCFIVYRLNKKHLVHLPWIPSKLKPSQKTRSEDHHKLFSQFIHMNANIDGEFVLDSKRWLKEKHIKAKLREENQEIPVSPSPSTPKQTEFKVDQKQEEEEQQQQEQQEGEAKKEELPLKNEQQEEKQQEQKDDVLQQQQQQQEKEQENELEEQEIQQEKQPDVVEQEESKDQEKEIEQKEENQAQQGENIQEEKESAVVENKLEEEKTQEQEQEKEKKQEEITESIQQDDKPELKEEQEIKPEENEITPVPQEEQFNQEEEQKPNEEQEKEQKQEQDEFIEPSKSEAKEEPQQIEEPQEKKQEQQTTPKATTSKDQDLETALKELRDDSTATNWIAVTYDKKKKTPIILGSGSGGIKESTSNLKEDQYAFVLVQVMLNESGYGMIPKMLMITWIGPKVKAMQKAQCTRNSINFTEEVKRIMEIHRQVHADSVEDLDESAIKTKLAGGKVEASEEGTASSASGPRFGGGKMQLNVQNEDEAISMLKDLGSSSVDTRWVVFSEFEKNGNCKAIASGSGDLEEWRQYLKDDDYCFIVFRVTEGDTSKNVFVKWVGPDLEGIRQAKSSGHHTLLLQFVKKHASIGSEFQANHENLSEDKIRMKVFGSGRVTDTPKVRTDLTPSEQWAQRKRASTGLVAESAGKFRRPRAPRKSRAPRRQSTSSVLEKAESEDTKTRVEANDFTEAEKHMKEVMEVTNAGITGEDEAAASKGVNILGGMGRKPGMPKGGGKDAMSMFGGANMGDILAQREKLRKSKKSEENGDNNNNDNNGEKTNNSQSSVAENKEEPKTPSTPKKKKKKKSTGKSTKKKKKKTKE